MTPILQSHLPFAPWMDARTARLPGVLPLLGQYWLTVDDAFVAQMAECDRLVQTTPHTVHALQDWARPAADELYGTILTALSRRPDYHISQTTARRPDGCDVPLDRDHVVRMIDLAPDVAQGLRDLHP